MSRSDTTSATIEALPDVWRRALDQLDLLSGGDGAARGGEVELTSAFAEKGFLRCLLDVDSGEPRLSIQFALPVEETRRARYVEAIQSEFEAITPFEWRTHRDDLQSTLETTADDSVDQEAIEAWFDRVSSLAEFVTSSTDGEETPDWLTRRLDSEDVASREEDKSDRSSTRERSRRSQKSRPTETDEASSSGSVPSSGAFEAIGGDARDVLRGRKGDDEGATSRASKAALEDYEIDRRGDAVEVLAQLKQDVSARVLEDLGRSMAHAIRARFDASAKPLSRSDVEARSTRDPNAELRLRVEPAEWSRGSSNTLDDLEVDLDNYLDRLRRFESLGVRLGEVLGIGVETESSEGRSDDRPSSASSRREANDGDESGRPERSERSDSKGRSGRQRGRGDEAPADETRRDAAGAAGARSDRDASESERPSDRSRDRDEPPTPEDDRRRYDSPRDRADDRRGASHGESEDEGAKQEEEDEVVLGGARDSDSPEEIDREPAEPETGLTPGDYTDPRLMREDATTSLVDVVLRHPGYAEEKMGHNLSILLGIDFPEAMELVETAPRVIAWGVGRERASRFKRVIQNAGGKVVLVEPDSLQE